MTTTGRLARRMAMLSFLGVWGNACVEGTTPAQRSTIPTDQVQSPSKKPAEAAEAAQPKPNAEEPGASPPGDVETDRHDSRAPGLADVPLSSELGVLHERLRISPPSNDAFLCPPVLDDVAALPGGRAWVVGACGFRVLLSPSGAKDTSAPPVTRSISIADSEIQCKAYPRYRFLAAWSENEALIGGPVSCGMDPNAVWPASPVLYDGAQWRPHSMSWPKPNGEEQRPGRVLALPEGKLLGVYSSDVHAATRCSIYERTDRGWNNVLRCDEGEDILSVAQGKNGRLLVLLERGGKYQKQSRHSVLKTWNGTAWKERPARDARLVQATRHDGTCLVGDEFRCGSDGKFERVAVLPSHRFLVGAHVVSPSDAWFALDADVVHYDGAGFSKVAFAKEAPKARLDGLRGAEDSLWVFSQVRVWELVTPESPPRPKVRVLQAPERKQN